MGFPTALQLRSAANAAVSEGSDMNEGMYYILKVTGIFRSLSLAKVKSSRLSLSMLPFEQSSCKLSSRQRGLEDEKAGGA